MKGAVFIALNELVESQHGIEAWELVLSKVNPECEGIYISTENYPDSDIQKYVQEISELLNLPTAAVTRVFGRFLFDELNSKFPMFTQATDELFTFLDSIENVIHKEVRKLFENPSLPTLDMVSMDNHTVEIQYYSPRKLCYLAEGLIQGASEFYNTEIRLEHPQCMHDNHDKCIFTITKIWQHLSMTIEYKAAYLRQKKARSLAEQMLEDRSRELYESNQNVIEAYKKLKQQNAQLLHQEKLASIGQLSAGVAHEINNPAGYVKSNLNTLSRYVDSLFDYIKNIEEQSQISPEIIENLSKLKQENDIEYIMEDLKDLVQDSLEGMERVASIVKSLKDFARPDTEESQYYCLNTCIQNTLKLVHNELKYKAEVEINLADLPEIYGQSGNMGQVILNLLVNAAQSIEKKGHITLTTTHCDKTVEISIADTGCGIPQDVIDRIFDPFFTTKKIGEGTGLGLSIVHSIVEKQGGKIEIKSKIGEGTEFLITLPISAPC